MDIDTDINIDIFLFAMKNKRNMLPLTFHKYKHLDQLEVSIEIKQNKKECTIFKKHI